MSLHVEQHPRSSDHGGISSVDAAARANETGVVMRAELLQGRFEIEETSKHRLSANAHGRSQRVPYQERSLTSGPFLLPSQSCCFRFAGEGPKLAIRRRPPL